MSVELLYGVNPVREALRGTREIFELFVQINATDHRLEKVLKAASELGVRTVRREKGDMTRLCGSPHHQGVALRVAPFGYAGLDELMVSFDAEGENGFLLVLDSIQDPHNLGAIIRTAASSGAKGVLIPKDRACAITAVVEKTSAGAVETVPVAQVTNISNAIELLKKSGFWIYGLDSGANESLYNTSFNGKIALVIGGEDEGIRPLVRKKCDQLLSIPSYGGVASLNASVAAGIAMYEVAKSLNGKRTVES